MMFMCCHPSLPPAARVALTLKTVGGFSVDEIAAAFLAEGDAIAQRLVITERAVAKHTASIFLKLDLQPSDDDNRRVLAVLAYLGG